jgi:hypothetical protein
MRHVVIEKPDGSVAIAFNEEVPPAPAPAPAPPPRNDTRISSRRTRFGVYICAFIWYKFGSF